MSSTKCYTHQEIVFKALNELPKRFYRLDSINVPLTITQLGMALYRLKLQGLVVSKEVYRTSIITRHCGMSFKSRRKKYLYKLK